MARMQMSLKARALKYLSQREHSRVELGRKLSAYASEQDDVEALLDILSSANLLSDERFTETLVRRRADRFGNARILSELKTHKIGGEALEALRASLSGDENERALVVLQRKFSPALLDAHTRAKQMRFLQQRGFSNAAIRYAMKVSAEFAEES